MFNSRADWLSCQELDQVKWNLGTLNPCQQLQSLDGKSIHITNQSETRQFFTILRCEGALKKLTYHIDLLDVCMHRYLLLSGKDNPETQSGTHGITLDMERLDPIQLVPLPFHLAVTCDSN